jgi:phosphoadenosine phosphosulfate reductase
MEEEAPFECIRYHPLINWSIRDVYAYLKQHDIPKHPLDAEGYMSIGCEPCTRKRHPEIDEREARWYGLNKVECGLQTDLIQKS